MLHVRCLSVIVVLAALAPSVVSAADVFIAAKIMVVKSGKLAKFVAKPSSGTFPLPTEDPTLAGATLHIFDTVVFPGPGAGNITFTLPASGWTGLGNPPGAKGFKFKASTGCHVVILKPTVIKAVCKEGATFSPPFQGPAGIALTAGSASAYCAELGGTELKNDAKITKRKDAPAPSQCAQVQPTPTPTDTRTPTSTGTITPTPANTATPSITPTNTPLPVCPLSAGKYTTTQTNSPSFCTGGPNNGMACTSDADCPGPQAGYTPFCGGNLTVYTFAPFPFPAGGTIVQDVSAGDANCVHNTVVPFPGGFSAPNFCVPALGYTVSVTQTGCGKGRIDSNGGSDFTVEETADTSDTKNSNCTAAGMPKTCCTGPGTGTCMGVCGLPQGSTPACTAGADGSGRVDIKVGDGSADVCVGSGVANALVEVPVHTVTWQDNSGGMFGACLGDGMFNAGDTIITQFNQILDFSTDTAHAHWADLDGDGCSLGGGGPAAGEAAIRGRCIDTSASPMTIATASAGGFFSAGVPYDGSFSTFLTSTVAQTGPFAGDSCASAPAINFTGTATRCLP